MNEFDRLVLEQFAKHLERHGTDIHDPKELRCEARIFVDMLTTTVFDFVEWSIEDDNRNKVRSAVSAGYSKMYPYNFIRYRKG